MCLTEVLMQTIVGFAGGRVGPATLIHFGCHDFGSHMAWLRARNFEYLLELMNRSNPDADAWSD